MSSKSPQLPQLQQQLSETDLDFLINKAACFKQRSHNTHTQLHQPQLESYASTTSSVLLRKKPQIDIVLLGDSMFERFKTSGEYTQIGQLSYPQLFNAGVGGDKIENVLYRINLGLVHLLKPVNPKVIVLQLGTNNLQRKQGLESRNIDDYNLLLQSLLIKLPTQPKVLVTGLFNREDVDEQAITQSNLALKELVARINTEEMKGNEPLREQCVHWMKPPKEFELDHLQDNVHLNARGYQMWNAVLYPKIQELLCRVE